MVLGADRSRTQAFTGSLARPLVWLRIPPNALTLASLVFALGAAFFFSQARWGIGFGVGAFAAALDFLDGAVARRTGRVSQFGGFLDSVVDRYVDAALLFGIGLGVATTQAWVLVALGVVGAFGTSYTRARLQQEIRLPAETWRQAVERPERLIILGAGLLAHILAQALGLGWNVLLWTLAAVAVASNWTAIQRVLLARRHLADTAT